MARGTRGNSNRERGGHIHATGRPTDDAAPIVAPIGGLSEANRAAIFATTDCGTAKKPRNDYPTVIESS